MEDTLRITLAAARVNAGLTQEDVAKALRIGKQTLVSWEKGKTEPKISQVKELEKLYGIPYTRIIFLSK